MNDGTFCPSTLAVFLPQKKYRSLGTLPLKQDPAGQEPMEVSLA